MATNEEYTAMLADKELFEKRWNDAAEEIDKLKLQVSALQKKLRTAQTVINKHVADQVEGLHCVNCTADADEICDCPMLVPIFEVMEGYENCAHANIEAVGEGFRRCKDCGEMEPPYPKKTNPEKRVVPVPKEEPTRWCTRVPEKDGTHQPDCVGERK